MSNQKTSAALLAEWIAAAKDARFLTAENGAAETEILQTLRLTDRSVMGCLLHDIGYVVCANGHIRILGGKNNACRSFFEVNKLYAGTSVFNGLLIVADTANGGLFALHGNQTNGTSEMLYLPYGSLTWERLDIGYADFVRWALSVSPTALAEGGWINAPSRDLPMKSRDAITQSKIDILLTVRKG